MGFLRKIWKNRQSEYPNRRVLIPTGNENEYDVSRSEGLIIEEGDLLSAEAFNDLEQRAQNAFKELEDSTMPKTGGDFKGHLTQQASSGFDFKTQNGAKLRIIGDAGSNYAHVRVVSADETWDSDLFVVDTTTGEIIRGSLMPKSGGDFIGNAKAATVSGSIKGIRNNVFYTSAGELVTDNINAIEFYDK